MSVPIRGCHLPASKSEASDLADDLKEGNECSDSSDRAHGASKAEKVWNKVMDNLGQN